MTGCAHNNAKIVRESTESKTLYESMSAELDRQSKPPRVPTDCKMVEGAGIKLNERLDVALIKADAALMRANSRISRCWNWYQKAVR